MIKKYKDFLLTKENNNMFNEINFDDSYCIREVSKSELKNTPTKLDDDYNVKYFALKFENENILFLLIKNFNTIYKIINNNNENNNVIDNKYYKYISQFIYIKKMKKVEAYNFNWLMVSKYYIQLFSKTVPTIFDNLNIDEKEYVDNVKIEDVDLSEYTDTDVLKKAYNK